MQLNTNKLLQNRNLINIISYLGLGEPYVYTVNTRDLSAVEEALKKIDKTKKPKPYVPYEFTYEGFLEASIYDNKLLKLIIAT